MSDNIDRKKERKGRTLLFLLIAGLLTGMILILFFNGSGRGAAVAGLLLLLFLGISPRWMIAGRKGIPILTFHSVSDGQTSTGASYLTLSAGDFSGMMHLLRKKGYRTVHLEDVRDHMSGRIRLQRRVFAVTFDDGYLDNWIWASPVMKGLGYFGTLFMATDFIDPRPGVRPVTDGALRETNASEAATPEGYLSADELREMEKTGLFRVESHTASHTWRFRNQQLKGFAEPGDLRMMWLLWNRDPAGKSRWQIRLGEKAQELWGHPVFGFSRSHMTKRAYFPDEALLRGMNDVVMENGGAAFFEKSDWRETLGRVYEALSRRYPGRWEDEAETRRRMDAELGESKRIIETLLEKKARFLCWPGDLYSEPLLEKALKTYGYEAVTGGEGRNAPGEDPALFSRVYVKHRYVPFPSPFLNKYLFYAELKTFEGNFYYFIPCLFFNLLNKILYLVYRRELEARK